MWAAPGKPFAKKRPLSKADLPRLSDHAVPVGPILAVRVAYLIENEAMPADGIPSGDVDEPQLLA